MCELEVQNANSGGEQERTHDEGRNGMRRSGSGVAGGWF
jgi:hypothetical protein